MDRSVSEIFQILMGLGFSREIVTRGYDLFLRNAVSDFKYNVDIKTNMLYLDAIVKGTHEYRTSIILKRLSNKLEIMGEVCSCPYNANNLCKHQTALLFKWLLNEVHKGFTSKNFTPQELKEQEEKRRIEEEKRVEAEKLAEIKRKEELEKRREAEKKRLELETFKTFSSWILNKKYNGKAISIDYRIKGLDKSSMVNFKLLFNFVGLEEDKKDEFYDNVFYEYESDFQELINYVEEEDFMILKQLRGLGYRKSSKDFGFLLGKEKLHFLFLKDLINKKKLFDEKGKIINYGGTISPQIEINGDEKEVFIKTKIEDKVMMKGRDCLWSMEGNTLYDVDEKAYGLPESIKIPEFAQAEFLFEYLPTIKNKYDAQVDEYFDKFKVMKIEPKVTAYLDYQNDEIHFRFEAKFNGEIYRNNQVNEKSFLKQHNTYEKTDETNWKHFDLSTVYDLKPIFDKTTFLLDGKKYILKDKNQIQSFILNSLPHFSEDWEVIKSDEFEKIKIEELELEPIVEFEDSDRIDWFAFTVKYSVDGKLYSRKDLQKLIEYNENGDAFIKIGPKYFLIKETESETKIKNIIGNAEENKDGSYKSSYYNMIYYRNLLENSGINFKGNEIYDAMNIDISTASIVEDIAVPPEVDGILRNYQKEGYQWLNFLNKYRFGGVLADDMGLGKTIQVLAFLKNLKKDKASLIVVPKSLIYNWKNEAEKFFPELKVLVYDGSPEWRKNQRDEFNNYELVISSFDVVSKDCDELKKLKFLYLVLDEAHNIKNRQTKRTANIKKVNSEYRLALTGTPLENSLGELWSIFDFVLPGYLGNFKHFSDNYIKNEEHKESKIHELKNKLSPFMLRRKKEDVLKELPDKIESIIPIEMNEEQQIAYRLVLDQVKVDLENSILTKGYNGSQITILAALMKLRQICNHPNLVFEDPNKNYESAKLDALLEIIKESIYAGHKILVFSQFVKMLKLIKDALAEEGIPFEYLDGSTRNRMEKVDNFNENEKIKVFLISLKAGGTGLNLTSADIVIHVDPWWNPQIERQATDRAHRMGQVKNVMVYKLITKGTVEEKMLKLQDRKKEIFDQVIDSNTNSISNITWSDIQDLLSYDVK